MEDFTGGCVLPSLPHWMDLSCSSMFSRAVFTMAQVRLLWVRQEHPEQASSCCKLLLFYHK